MTLGIDMGGTYLRYELKNQGKSVQKETLLSSGTALCSFIETMLEKNLQITTVCIAYAGQVQDGVILSAPHIIIDKKNVKAYIESKYEVVLFIENDLNCAVLAEANFSKSRNICALYVGTGMGLGVLSDSKLLCGYENLAAELGHIPYKTSPFVCSCGKSNCIELYCSGSGLQRWEESSMCEEELQKMFFEALMHAIGTTITLFNPQKVILGGGVISHYQDLLSSVTKELKKFAMPLLAENVQLEISQLQDAPLEGAFLLKEYYA